MKLVRYIVVVFSIFMITPVFSMEWVFGRVSKVEDYGSYDNGNFQVLITLQNKSWPNNGTGATNCTHRFRVKTGVHGVTEKIKDRIFTLMLSAHLTERRAGLYIDPNSGPYCTVQIGRIGDDF